jgi:ketosteroid isomerase-like protein
VHTARHRLSRSAFGVVGAVGAVFVALSVLPPATVAADGRVLTPAEMDVEFVRLFNENRIDELGDFYYAPNALLMPPNHEPIRGREKIVEYLKGLRQTAGEFQTGVPPLQVVEAGDLTSVVNQGAFLQGGVRAVMHEAFQRQADGSWKVIVDMPGFRDPQR